MRRASRASESAAAAQLIEEIGRELVGRPVAPYDLMAAMDAKFRLLGWQGLVGHYGLRFEASPRQVSPNFLYKALEQGDVDPAEEWGEESVSIRRELGDSLQKTTGTELRAVGVDADAQE